VKRGLFFLFLSTGILLVIIGLFTSIDFYTDFLFFKEVGYRSVFMKELLTKLYLGLVVALTTTSFYLLNIVFANRHEFPQARVYFIDKNIYGFKKYDTGRIVKTASLYLSVFVFIFSAVYGSQYWKQYLLFSNAQIAGIKDPIFGMDISFYMFKVPFLKFVNKTATVVILFTLSITAINYILRGGITYVEGLFSINRFSKIHISLLTSLLILSFTIKFYLDRYGLLFSRHSVLFGASYTDVQARLLMLNIMCILGVLTAIGFFFAMTRKKIIAAVFPLGLFLAFYLVGLGLYPSLLQSFKVTPNEIELEKPYIEHHIKFTRIGYDLERITVKPFDVSVSLQYSDIQKNISTIRNIRLWDEEPLLKTYSQLQQIRTYYKFIDVDNDRYRLNGRYIQVMLSPRELSYEDLPGKSWINERLVYTHGIGLAMGSVSGITREGLPEFIMKDIPPTSTQDISVKKPEIYFGEKANEYVIVNTKVKEFSYPTTTGNVYTHYEGSGGIKLSSFPLRFLFALKFGSLKIVLSSDITSNSRILYYRNILERAERIAPFMAYDSDPYMVVGKDGKLYWFIDAYTYSTSMPYSEPIRGGLNYIRNPVKVVIDAYDGTVRFFVVDSNDIIIKTYRSIYPSLFKDIEDMPEDLRLHIRYPRTLMKIQARMFATYHMTDPRVFYNKEDLWEIPAYRGKKMEPYYIILRLPDGDKEEFVLLVPFTPSKRDNLAAWMAARCDGKHYGEVVVYTFPRDRLVFGPRQIDARIDQNAYISQQLTLWGQRGSDVIRGSLLIIPIEKSLLYVQPLYLVATDRVGLPELRRVIVAYGDKVVMKETLEDAIRSLFKGISLPKKTLREPSEERLNPAETALKALEFLRKAKEALKQENWQGFGENLKKAEETLERIKASKVK
jgi:hypothetical protein